MTNYVIEKNVPICSIGLAGGVRKENSLKGTMRRLEVGDSFLATNSRNVVSATAQLLRREFSGRVYVTRSVDGGIRVWRVA